ncbi:hypothetical protein SOVF_144720 isoform B [Spinacia oleracea]|uniref:Uncharacterized protein isoform X2 n=1 Tax=Spinacia oleracea TaxID=3562 RepID=A0A9R0IXM4_SPIOL|nr:uncharacterized protein LOC110796643 isoform X2 [Spinacia oleracea]KNA10402.1 hypothetical protein SOVF_144720 isoform B [Spinacia oleracea]
MDEKVAKWIIEFLLRKPIDEKIINGVLSCLPLSNNDKRLKKTILLRKIESAISDGSVSEKLLELLEMVDELNHGAGKTVPDSMKRAYCAVAVDCTVRFLEENVEENGKYFEAVERVWRDRVCKVESLVSEELNRWLEDIEAAVWDSSVCEKILMRNTRNEALRAVKRYLKEAWESMGPSFLELVALKVGNDVGELCRSEGGGGGDGGGGGGSGSSGGGGSGGVVGSDNPCRTLIDPQGLVESQAFNRRKHVAVKTRRPRGIKIFDAVEAAETSMNTANDIQTREMDKVQETLQPSSTQQHGAANDSHPSTSRTAHNLSCGKNNDAPIYKMDKVQEALQPSSTQLHGAVNDSHPSTSRTARNLSCGKDNDAPIFKMDKVQEALESNSFHLHADVSDSHLDPLEAVHNMSVTKVTDNMSNLNAIKKQTTHETPEVRRVQEALNFSARELHEAVTDPLPEALEIAKTLSSAVGATLNHGTGHVTGVENQNTSNDDVLENQTTSNDDVLENQNTGNDGVFENHNTGSDTVFENHNTGNDAVLENQNTGNDAVLENRNTGNDDVLENQIQPPVIHATEKNTENVEEEMPELAGDAQGNNETDDPKKQHRSKRSLMEANGTSHTFEWDDSIDNVNRGSELHLPPSPKRSKVTPLEQYEDKPKPKPQPLIKGRKKWSVEEEDTLRVAVKELGRNWKLILQCHGDAFEGRSNVDLKDKWRNMLRSQL